MVDVSRAPQGQTSGGFLLLAVVPVSRLISFLSSQQKSCLSILVSCSIIRGASLRTLIEPLVDVGLPFISCCYFPLFPLPISPLCTPSPSYVISPFLRLACDVMFGVGWLFLTRFLLVPRLFSFNTTFSRKLEVPFAFHNLDRCCRPQICPSRTCPVVNNSRFSSRSHSFSFSTRPPLLTRKTQC